MKRTPRPWTKAWARIMLVAVRLLIKEYRDGERLGSCPLCACSIGPFCGDIDTMYCEVCPWVVFTGYRCFGDKKRGGKQIKKPCENATLKQRLFRLYGWQRRLLNIINKPVNICSH